MTVKIEGLEAVMRKLNSLNKPGVFKKPMNLAIDHVAAKLKREPTKSGTWSAWADMHPAARRAYWAKVASGEAQHGAGGYIRSHRLYRGWQKKISGDGRRGEFLNDVDYAPYVQGDRQIAPHSASGYSKVSQVAKDEADFIAGIFKRAYDRELNK